MTKQADTYENFGKVTGFAGEVISIDCLVLRLSLRTELDDRIVEIRMTADMVVRLAAELARISTQAI